MADPGFGKGEINQNGMDFRECTNNFPLFTQFDGKQKEGGGVMTPRAFSEYAVPKSKSPVLNHNITAPGCECQSFPKLMETLVEMCCFYSIKRLGAKTS